MSKIEQPLLLTREELAHGRALLEKAFKAPWRYKMFEIECGTCRADRDGTSEEDCSNPECDGDSVPCVFVESPEEYPADEEFPQVVATIDVPGMSCLAEQNGEAICWLRNNAANLIQARDYLDVVSSALAWLSCAPDTSMSRLKSVESTIEYALSLGWRPSKP